MAGETRCGTCLGNTSLWAMAYHYREKLDWMNSHQCKPHNYTYFGAIYRIMHYGEHMEISEVQMGKKHMKEI